MPFSTVGRLCLTQSAAIIIWQGSVRTKKKITVENKLREALGVPLAIGLGNNLQTRDGSYVVKGETGNVGDLHVTSRNDDLQMYRKTSKDPLISEVSHDHHEKDTATEDSGRPRRATITFGSVPDRAQSKQRSTTVPVPPRAVVTDGADVGVIRAATEALDAPAAVASETTEAEVNVQPNETDLGALPVIPPLGRIVE